MPNISVNIQKQDFDAQSELDQLQEDALGAGAFIQFIGCVRPDLIHEAPIEGLFLEHYPGMTEKSIQSIIKQACGRWELKAVSVIHRIGRLNAGDNIVYVGVASSHRKDSFESAMFIMDYLKNDVPIWKKESHNGVEHWVEQKVTDKAAKNYWE